MFYLKFTFKTDNIPVSWPRGAIVKFKNKN